MKVIYTQAKALAQPLDLQQDGSQEDAVQLVFHPLLLQIHAKFP